MKKLLSTLACGLVLGGLGFTANAADLAWGVPVTPTEGTLYKIPEYYGMIKVATNSKVDITADEYPEGVFTSNVNYFILNDSWGAVQGIDSPVYYNRMEQDSEGNFIYYYNLVEDGGDMNPHLSYGLQWNAGGVTFTVTQDGEGGGDVGPSYNITKYLDKNDLITDPMWFTKVGALTTVTLSVDGWEPVYVDPSKIKFSPKPGTGVTDVEVNTPVESAEIEDGKVVISLGTILDTPGYYEIQIGYQSIIFSDGNDVYASVYEEDLYYEVTDFVYTISPKDFSIIRGTFDGFSILGNNVDVTTSMVTIKGTDEGKNIDYKGTLSTQQVDGGVKVVLNSPYEDLVNANFIITIAAGGVSINGNPSTSPITINYTVKGNLPAPVATPASGYVFEEKLEDIVVTWGNNTPLVSGSGKVSMKLPNDQNVTLYTSFKNEYEESELETPIVKESKLVVDLHSFDEYTEPGKYVITIPAGYVEATSYGQFNEEVVLTYYVKSDEVEPTPEEATPIVEDELTNVLVNKLYSFTPSEDGTLTVTTDSNFALDFLYSDEDHENTIDYYGINYGDEGNSYTFNNLEADVTYYVYLTAPFGESLESVEMTFSMNVAAENAEITLIDPVVGGAFDADNYNYSNLTIVPGNVEFGKVTVEYWLNGDDEATVVDITPEQLGENMWGLQIKEAYMAANGNVAENTYFVVNIESLTYNGETVSCDIDGVTVNENGNISYFYTVEAYEAPEQEEIGGAEIEATSFKTAEIVWFNDDEEAYALTLNDELVEEVEVLAMNADAIVPDYTVAVNEAGNALVITFDADLAFGTYRVYLPAGLVNVGEDAVNAMDNLYFNVDETTGISGIFANDGDVKVYNLQGVRVNKENLSSGLYIINGKKVMIRK